MKVIVGMTSNGLQLREAVTKELKRHSDIEIIELAINDDVFALSSDVVQMVLENPTMHRGIIIDDYGVAPFMIASKHKYIICSETNDEHSAKMTRDHNNANVIAIGADIVGKAVAISIVNRFVTGKYAAGRHQIRIDMLNKMC